MESDFSFKYLIKKESMFALFFNELTMFKDIFLKEKNTSGKKLFRSKGELYE
jgi:hypothetical protein